jgi:hypothetical protein
MVPVAFSLVLHTSHVGSNRQVSSFIGHHRSAAHCEAPSAGAIKTTESPMALLAYIPFSPQPPWPTSHEQHLALLLDRPDAWFLVFLFLLCNEYGLFDVSEYKIAM